MRRVLPLLPLLALLALPLAGTAPVQAASAWSWPLPGTPEVDRPFQPPASAWGAGHRGVDLHGELHEPVLAAGAGTVTYAGVLAGRGVVTVTHEGGLRTTYEPVGAIVGVGERVEAGDVIGTLDTGHASCRLGTVCLHWGLLRGQTYLDPLTLVVAGRLRLLSPSSSPSPADRTHRKKSRSRRSSSDERPREAPEKEGFAKRLGRVARRAAKSTGRVAGRVGKAVGRAGLRLARGAGRVGARAGVRAAPYAVRAAPYAARAVPYVGVVVLVGGTAWYLYRRRRR